MTGLLASVRDEHEAGLVLEAGADIIDLKEPAAGALGAVDAAVIGATMARIGGRARVSATIGDVPCTAEHLRPRLEAVAASGVDFIKIGVFGRPDAPGVLALLEETARAGHRIVLVFFAEDPFHETAFPEFARCGITGVMLDTRDKHSGALRDKLTQPQLASFVTRARSAGLLCGLAGSLGIDDIPALLPLRPDYLGFRGGLCRGNDRIQRLDAEAVGRIRRALSGHVADAARAPCYM